jgi:predicted dehydrogenase
MTANDRVLAEAFMYLHAPLTAEAVRLTQQAIREPDASPIGKLTKIEARFDIAIEDGWDPTPKSNVRYSRALMGGALMDLGCYPLSFARTVLGEPLLENVDTFQINATMVDLFEGTPNDGSDAVDGAATLAGTTPSGIELDLSCSMIERDRENGGRAPDVVARLIGERGTAEIRDFPRPERIVLAGEGVDGNMGGERVIGSPLADSAEVYRIQAESFARAALSMADGGAGEPTPSAAWSIEQAGAIERVLEKIGVRFDEPAW